MITENKDLDVVVAKLKIRGSPMKKLLTILMCVLLISVMFAGCSNQSAPAVEPSEPEGPEYKIGIMTGTVSQNEEEYRSAENMKAKYGDMIVTTTYPDQFNTEQETTISNMVALASDPLVKAIIMNQGVLGAAAAIDRVRELRPDMLFILGGAAEDPEVITKKADIILGTDTLKRGVSIIEQAHKLGAKTFVHYSFARHLSYETLVKRLGIMKETAASLGMVFVEADAPDPTSDAGVSGTQQFIMEDVPRKLEQYGKDTAVFGTNCAMQEPMIKQVVAYGGIYPVQCCPSPYHALPGALGISIPDDKKGDVAWLMAEMDAKLAGTEADGRVSTWPVPVSMLITEVGVEYAQDFIEGKTEGRVDKARLLELFSELSGVEITLNPWISTVTGEPINNYLMTHLDYYTFGTHEGQ